MMPCFDIQVNGYAGVDFNSDTLTAEGLEFACQQLHQNGVTKILATVITAPIDAMRRRIQAIAAAIATRDAVARVVAGIHIEGPFISSLPGYVGAHPAHAAIPADLRVCQQLCAAGEGWVRMVTLAPEVDVAGQMTRFFKLSKSPWLPGTPTPPGTNSSGRSIKASAVSRTWVTAVRCCCPDTITSSIGF
jgi:N-acetylglucosamine-6-phosphate deacetylase